LKEHFIKTFSEPAQTFNSFYTFKYDPAKKNVEKFINIKHKIAQDLELSDEHFIAIIIHCSDLPKFLSQKLSHPLPKTLDDLMDSVRNIWTTSKPEKEFYKPPFKKVKYSDSANATIQQNQFCGYCKNHLDKLLHHPEQYCRNKKNQGKSVNKIQQKPTKPTNSENGLLN
jgi:hypothetical protein